MLYTCSIYNELNRDSLGSMWPSKVINILQLLNLFRHFIEYCLCSNINYRVESHVMERKSQHRTWLLKHNMVACIIGTSEMMWFYPYCVSFIIFCWYLFSLIVLKYISTYWGGNIFLLFWFLASSALFSAIEEGFLALANSFTSSFTLYYMDNTVVLMFWSEPIQQLETIKQT